MTVGQLHAIQHARPFRPYRIHMANRRSLDVLHPDFVACAPKGRSATAYKPDETFEVIDLLFVAGFEVLNGQSTLKRTG